MKKELRKSTESQAVSTYFAMRASCQCMNYCGAETPWYPREAEAREYYAETKG